MAYYLTLPLASLLALRTVTYCTDTTPDEKECENRTLKARVQDGFIIHRRREVPLIALVLLAGLVQPRVIFSIAH
ncbi:hypothetical protein OKW41_005551 [Paraburkholderia sp. UCT70]|uniref:hypothetical protein n=1 Tax=Paraburkholderia sp. UCT70 TaxID=2991068 RepID=UPI003D1CCFD6